MKATTQNNLQHAELFAPQVFLGAAIDRMADAESAERGAIFTRREVVDFMLDLAGYTADRPLFQFRLLEPSFGSGDFLLAALDRLLESWQHHTASLDDLENAIRGVELHRSSFLSTRDRLMHRLLAAGITEDDATRLTNLWLTQGDFLLEAVSGDFDFVIGNPPYVRQESIPAALLAAYRQRYVTLYDRADLYVPFIERSLSLLKTGGSLIFICSDRWMKNRYGGPLREMVTHGYGLKYYVDMVGTAAFQSEVIAYPAITVITRQQQKQTRIAHQPEISAAVLAHLCQEMTGPHEKLNGCVTEIAAPARGDAPWLLEADAQSTLSLVRRLEAEFPTLEEAGCKVGIGVATGADKVFIGLMSELDVEEERKLPLAMTRDILDGTVCWRGLGVVNPFEEDGSLADFAAYPKFAAFMARHAVLLKARHCAQKSVDGWYRTIDRITPALARTPKLLIPDIKGVAHIVHEEGRLYPHHNLYHIISAHWPLPELRCVLMAGIAHLFVRAYSTKMHGGSLRFQAQYLRRIRLPHWHDVSAKNRKALAAATISQDQQATRAIVVRLYAMTDEEQAQLFA